MADHPQRTILWRLDLLYTLVGINCQNSFYFYNKDVVPDESLSNYAQFLAEDFQTTTFSTIQVFQNEAVHYQSIKVLQLIPQPGHFHETQIANQTGAQVNDTLPSHDAAVLSLYSPLAGRSRRGRLYFAGVDEGLVVANTLENPYFEQLQDIGRNLLQFFGNGGANTRFFYCLYSKKLGDNVLHQPTFAGVQDIHLIIGRKQIATQRHRKQGHGP